MSLGNRITEILGLLGDLTASRKGEFYSLPSDERSLAVSAIKFRIRSMLKHRASIRFDRTNVLGLRINFNDSGFFQQNFGEIFTGAEYFIRMDTDTPSIVDCGANIGLATLYFKRLYPEARIISIEAHPDTFAILKSNLESNRFGDVELVNAALVDSDADEIPLYSSDIAGDLRATTIESFYHDANLAPNPIRVEARRLSDLLPARTDLLKLDIEGAEASVLFEIKDHLGSIQNIIFEFHSMPDRDGYSLAQVLSFLEGSGFRCLVKGDCNEPISTYSNRPFANIVFATRGT